MDTDTLIRRLNALGVAMSANGDRLELRPGSRIPADLHDAIRLHKAALFDRLAPHTPDDDELTDIVRRVIDNGYCLLWSHVLRDFVAFVRTVEDANSVPRHFTVYYLDELMQVFGGRAPHTPDALRLIHRAKQFGGKIRSD